MNTNTTALAALRKRIVAATGRPPTRQALETELGEANTAVAEAAQAAWRAHDHLVQCRTRVLRATVALEHLAASEPREVPTTYNTYEDAAAEPTFRDEVRDLAQSSKFDGYTTPWMRRRGALLYLVSLNGGVDTTCGGADGDYFAAIGRHVLHEDDRGFVSWISFRTPSGARYFIESEGA